MHACCSPIPQAAGSFLDVTNMNTNGGNDPMLSSFMGDDWNKFSLIAALSSSSSSPTIATHSLTIAPAPASHVFSVVPDGLLSPEPLSSSFTDFASLWGNERKRVTSIKMEDEDSYLTSPRSAQEESEDVDMEDIDISGNADVSDIKSEVLDPDYVDVKDEVMDPDYETVLEVGHLGKRLELETSGFKMSEAAARRYVEEEFCKVAFVPHPGLSHRGKIEYILSHSECREYSVDQILNFDKRSADSARACAKIVQNIPQRYRWDCVKPEDIPCCYTIVADCKKVSSRDKPPRPMNAFMIWAQGARRLINELCPKMQNAAISEALGFCWRQKSDAYKKRFEQEKSKLRVFHNVEFPEYKYKPKTKVQKAKEKQELSLSKAKALKVVTKKARVQKESTGLHRKRNKCGRPRKIKPEDVAIQEITTKSPQGNDSNSESTLKMSPTKPAIKDMLTLKILNDRRSKGMGSVSQKGDTVLSSLGQLSPKSGDLSDEFGNLDSANTSVSPRADKMLTSSSVYDTPANTPPVDAEEEVINILSSPQSSLTSSSLSPVSPPSSMFSPVVFVTSSPSSVTKTSCAPSVSTSSPSSKMPSLSAILASKVSLAAQVSVKSSTLRQITGSVQCAPKTPRKEPEVKEGFPTFLSDVAEVLSHTQQTVQKAGTPVGTLPGNASKVMSRNLEIDMNNNNSSSNRNSSSDNNNNNNNNNYGGMNNKDSNNNVSHNKNVPLCFVANTGKGIRSSVASSGAELTDLDSLCLDLDINVPLLSDDDMRCLLDSL